MTTKAERAMRETYLAQLQTEADRRKALEAEVAALKAERDKWKEREKKRRTGMHRINEQRKDALGQRDAALALLKRIQAHNHHAHTTPTYRPLPGSLELAIDALLCPKPTRPGGVKGCPCCRADIVPTTPTQENKVVGVRNVSTDGGTHCDHGLPLSVRCHKCDAVNYDSPHQSDAPTQENET